MLPADNMIIYIGKSQGIYKKTPRTRKWLQQGCRIQDQHIKIYSISIYYHWTHGTEIKNLTPLTIIQKVKFLCITNRICTELVGWNFLNIDERNQSKQMERETHNIYGLEDSVKMSVPPTLSCDSDQNTSKCFL